jgi:hypothetical protein
MRLRRKLRRQQPAVCNEIRLRLPRSTGSIRLHQYSSFFAVAENWPFERRVLFQLGFG